MRGKTSGILWRIGGRLPIILSDGLGRADVRATTRRSFTPSCHYSALTTVRTAMPTKDQIAQAEWLAALGEPTRLKLLRLLATGQKTVTQLAALSQTEMVNVSHHLKLLKNVGLVTTERDGRYVIYSLAGVKATAVAMEASHASGAKISIPMV